MAANSQQFETRAAVSVKSANEVSELKKEICDLVSVVKQLAKVEIGQPTFVCQVCHGTGHSADVCPSAPKGVIPKVNAIGGYNYNGQNKRRDPFNQTYNPGWRDHSKFKWGGQNEQAQPHHGAPSGSGMSLEDIVKSLADNSFKFQQDTQHFQQDTKKAIEALGTQVSQLATSISRLEKQSGKLSSQPKSILSENVSAITLRSGKELEPPVESVKEPKLENPEISSSDQTVFPPQNKQGVSSHPYPPLDAYVPKAHFPSKLARLKKPVAGKNNELLEMFRRVEINIPLLDAIKQIPKYEKFLKELCTRKRQAKEKEMMVISQSVSAILQKNFQKYRRIQYLIETGVIIQLADRSFIHPLGVIEDVLVQVNELLFPAYFYVLKMEEPTSISSASILLGRPFVKMAKTKIDVDEGTLSMEFDGELVKFNIFDDIKTSTIGQEHSLC
ncbi:uncharacterized protein LOC120069694 [Benincasa hispida]|uniref:uncharacterized protein LOC120069694 n=1 Tax=Benincasa hispida TaxID=102211 RepID=UPI00190241BC|nr:uncharacterized protein LOC120069694 [Benincasa hispida]